MRKSRILIVDDDIGVVKALRANLQKDNDFETLTAMNGAEALQVIEREFLDLVILDIMMPRMDGFEVCRQVREWSQIPILMLSACHDVKEKARCLDSGADDYMTKPFGINELIARVRAILRRTKDLGTVLIRPSFTSGNLKINFAGRQVNIGENEVKLTPTEYNLLQTLVLDAGKVFSHAMLLGKVWGPEYAEEREYLRVFIGRIRKKIEEDPYQPKHIITIPGVGYKFQDNTA